MFNGRERSVVYVPAGKGPSICVAGDTYTIKASRENTTGTLAFLEASVPPGAGPKPHVHTREDEAYYILSGELEILNRNQTFVAGPGDFIFIPRGILHRFRNPGIHTARMVFLFTPAGFDDFLMEVGKPARPGLPSAPWLPEDDDRIAAAGPRYGRRTSEEYSPNRSIEPG
jgi:mannose-6-phosphate isomerase-like protein (cupin superfamily)